MSQNIVNMKILVCISKTPDTTAKIEFSGDQTEFVQDGVNFILNPYDEWYALVRAIELKESHDASVTVAHVGTASNDSLIRKALAIGADDAIRIDKEAISSRDVATQIAAVVTSKGFDWVFTGKETIDYNGNEVGAMIAAILDWPFISYANKLEYDGSKATIDREIEGGVEKIAVSGSFVLSASKGLAEQRIPNMRGIMMAKRKPLAVETAVDYEAKVKIAKYAASAGRSECQYVDADNIGELVRLLHEEAKAI